MGALPAINPLVDSPIEAIDGFADTEPPGILASAPVVESGNDAIDGIVVKELSTVIAGISDSFLPTRGSFPLPSESMVIARFDGLGTIKPRTLSFG
jgi:hypothetical protein